MTSEMDLLNHNFQEIYRATHINKPAKLQLVANLSGTHIYASTQGWGRLWCWFYGIASWLTCQDLHLSNLKRAVINTHQLFHTQLSLMAPYLKDYQTYVDKMGEEYAVSESDYFAARHKITHWNACTLPFINMLRHQGNQPVMQQLRHCFVDYLPKEELSTLFIPEAAQNLRACQQIIDLEGMSEGPLPMLAFKKILKGKFLNAIDHSELDKWIKKINQTAPPIVNEVHQALNAICQQYNKKDPPHPSMQIDATALEILLENKGCTVFKQIDPKHMQWRNNLKKGSQIPFNTTEIMLTEEIQPAYSTSEHLPIFSDHTRVFGVAGKEACVAMTAQNRAALPMKYLRNRQEIGFGLRTAQLLEISDDGRLALMEKLHPLDARPWTSQNDILSEEDAPTIKTLTMLLQWFIKYNLTPVNFSSDSLMLDSQYRLKSLKSMQKGPFDFNALEDFCWQCAAGNSTIFKQLMTKSGLATHDVAKFYHEMLANSLKGDNLPTDDLAGIYKIGDPKVVDRAIELSCKVLGMQQRLLRELKVYFPMQDEKELALEIAKTILDGHQASKAAGLLWGRYYLKEQTVA